VAVARYVRSTSVPTKAKLAVSAADDWQQLGWDGADATLAARGLKEGITDFTVFILASNAPVHHLLDFSREDEQRDAGYGTTEIRLRIPDDPLGGERGAAHALGARGSDRTAARTCKLGHQRGQEAGKHRQTENHQSRGGRNPQPLVPGSEPGDRSQDQQRRGNEDD